MEEVAAVSEAPQNSKTTTEQDRKPRKDKTNRRKEEKSIENVLKTMSHLPTPLDKFELLCTKYSELAEELKQLQMGGRLSEKRLVVVQREKEKLQGELSKSVQTRNKLELLCRELQKHNKAMKEESLLRIKEEEEKRKEVSAKFHTTLAEITSLMQQNSESNSKLRDENQSIQTQFKGVCEQYEIREQQVDKMAQQMRLESQLAEAKLAKARLEFQAQKDIHERDKAQLMAEVAMCRKKCEDHEKTEALLRGQINVYFEKYDEFQNVLTKSNHVYTGFKSEMEKMSKKITRLEKETATWKQKWESTHKALLAMATEKQGKDQEVAQQQRQLTQLQKLCRTLQSQRSALLQQLSASGITPAKAAEIDGKGDEACNEVSPALQTSPDTANLPQNKVGTEGSTSTTETENPSIKLDQVSSSTDVNEPVSPIKSDSPKCQDDVEAEVNVGSEKPNVEKTKPQLNGGNADENKLSNNKSKSQKSPKEEKSDSKKNYLAQTMSPKSQNEKINAQSDVTEVLTGNIVGEDKSQKPLTDVLAAQNTSIETKDDEPKSKKPHTDVTQVDESKSQKPVANETEDEKTETDAAESQNLSEKTPLESSKVNETDSLSSFVKTEDKTPANIEIIGSDEKKVETIPPADQMGCEADKLTNHEMPNVADSSLLGEADNKEQPTKPDELHNTKTEAESPPSKPVEHSSATPTKQPGDKTPHSKKTPTTVQSDKKPKENGRRRKK